MAPPLPASMRGLRAVAFALPLLVGCGSDEPGWAIDPIFLDPTEAGATGNQLWQVYREAWGRSYAPRHYLCSVLIGLQASDTPPDCPDCQVAFQVETERADTDCSEGIAVDATWTTLTRVGFGSDTGDGPHPQASVRAWADYGEGWVEYGWAHPDALDHGGEPASLTWNGVEPFAFVPTSALHLSGDALAENPAAARLATSVSRSGLREGATTRAHTPEAPVQPGKP